MYGLVAAFGLVLRLKLVMFQHIYRPM